MEPQSDHEMEVSSNGSPTLLYSRLADALALIEQLEGENKVLTERVAAAESRTYRYPTKLAVGGKGWVYENGPANDAINKLTQKVKVSIASGAQLTQRNADLEKRARELQKLQDRTYIYPFLDANGTWSTPRASAENAIKAWQDWWDKAKESSATQEAEIKTLREQLAELKKSKPQESSPASTSTADELPELKIAHTSLEAEHDKLQKEHEQISIQLRKATEATNKLQEYNDLLSNLTRLKVEVHDTHGLAVQLATLRSRDITAFRDVSGAGMTNDQLRQVIRVWFRFLKKIKTPLRPSLTTKWRYRMILNLARNKSVWVENDSEPTLPCAALVMACVIGESAELKTKAIATFADMTSSQPDLFKQIQKLYNVTDGSIDLVTPDMVVRVLVEQMALSMIKPGETNANNELKAKARRVVEIANTQLEFYWYNHQCTFGVEVYAQQLATLCVLHAWHQIDRRIILDAKELSKYIDPGSPVKEEEVKEKNAGIDLLQQEWNIRLSAHGLTQTFDVQPLDARVETYRKFPAYSESLYDATMKLASSWKDGAQQLDKDNIPMLRIQVEDESNTPHTQRQNFQAAINARKRLFGIA